MAVSDAFTSFFDEVGNLLFGYSDKEKKDIAEMNQQSEQRIEENMNQNNGEYSYVDEVAGTTNIENILVIGFAFTILILFLKD